MGVPKGVEGSIIRNEYGLRMLLYPGLAQRKIILVYLCNIQDSKVFFYISVFFNYEEDECFGLQ